eukprot:4600246-Pleurochrysis_carterae.AAC.3
MGEPIWQGAGITAAIGSLKSAIALEKWCRSTPRRKRARGVEHMSARRQGLDIERVSLGHGKLYLALVLTNEYGSRNEQKAPAQRVMWINGCTEERGQMGYWRKLGDGWMDG